MDEAQIYKKKTHQYEYTVLKKLGELSSPHIVKVFDYNEETQIMTMERVPGKTLRKCLDTKHYLHVLYVIMDLHEKIKFTHYDLHYDNVIMRPMDSYKLFKYTIMGKEYTIYNKLCPVIIDTEYSYLDGVCYNPAFKFPILHTGIVQSVYDDLFDIFVLMSDLLSYVDEHERTLLAGSMFQACNFYLSEFKIDLSKHNIDILDNYYINRGRQITGWNLQDFVHMCRRFNITYETSYPLDTNYSIQYSNLQQVFDYYDTSNPDKHTLLYAIAGTLHRMKLESMKYRLKTKSEVFEWAVNIINSLS